MSKTEKETIADMYKVEPISFANENGTITTIKPYGYERNTEHRGDGLSAHYYELPKGATELRHIIKHKKMEHGIGEAFCALYRLNDNGEYLRNLKKALFYIQAAIEYEEKE